jgi:hypothetical protein
MKVSVVGAISDSWLMNNLSCQSEFGSYLRTLGSVGDLHIKHVRWSYLSFRKVTVVKMGKRY